ncbi:MAG: DinB family protein [Acidimicrobiales bacterium]
MDTDEDLPKREFGWSDMFVHEDDDPRSDGGWNNDERSVLLGFLADRRLSLEMKCGGLDPAQMAQQSVPPSNLSLLGLVRHLTSVEHYWFQSVIAGIDDRLPYHNDAGDDLAFEIEPDPDLVNSAWAMWRDEVASSNRCIDEVADLGQLAPSRAVPVREVLVHLIREYAQHLGHADLIRERIDGRIGQ